LSADRIAATLQLLTFFFISVFAFDPRTFCEDAVANGYSYACGDNQNDWPDFFQLPVSRWFAARCIGPPHDLKSV
jgi:hypothetical protein